MSSSESQQAAPVVLIVGAGRGLGHAMAAEFLTRGWHVIGTVRPGSTGTGLHDLAEAERGRVEIEALDINEPSQIAALRDRLADRTLDILFVPSRRARCCSWPPAGSAPISAARTPRSPSRKRSPSW